MTSFDLLVLTAANEAQAASALWRGDEREGMWLARFFDFDVDRQGLKVTVL